MDRQPWMFKDKYLVVTDRLLVLEFQLRPPSWRSMVAYTSWQNENNLECIFDLWYRLGIMMITKSTKSIHWRPASRGRCSSTNSSINIQMNRCTLSKLIQFECYQMVLVLTKLLPKFLHISAFFLCQTNKKLFLNFSKRLSPFIKISFSFSLICWPKFLLLKG